MGDYFYCYSKKMYHFIAAFDIKYLNIGVNSNTKCRYYVFEKSERLDKVIALYKQVKHSIN